MPHQRPPFAASVNGSDRQQAAQAAVTEAAVAAAVAAAAAGSPHRPISSLTRPTPNHTTFTYKHKSCLAMKVLVAVKRVIDYAVPVRVRPDKVRRG